MLVRYCEVKKKPAWASVRDHCREKIGREGARILGMMPIMMKPACNKNHSKRGLEAEGDDTVESIEKGVWHKMDGGTRRRGSVPAQSECVGAATQEGFMEVFRLRPFGAQTTRFSG